MGGCCWDQEAEVSVLKVEVFNFHRDLILKSTSLKEISNELALSQQCKEVAINAHALPGEETSTEHDFADQLENKLVRLRESSVKYTRWFVESERSCSRLRDYLNTGCKECVRAE